MGSTNLNNFLNEKYVSCQLDKELFYLIEIVADSCKKISNIIRNEKNKDLFGDSNSFNIQGEQQKKLDVIANEILIKDTQSSGYIAGIASEELDDIYKIPEIYKKGKYILLFDPLDGSSNIDVNISIGTIFSILEIPDKFTINNIKEIDYLQPGINQIAAGYVLYGPKTNLNISFGQGVSSFFLDAYNSWILSEEKITIPENTNEFSVNISNMRFWESPIKKYISDCLSGLDGPLAKNYNMRWVGSMVADVHRILKKGGIFLYPNDFRLTGKTGKLRLMYEVNPMSFLIEQAGGLSIDCENNSILEIKPTKLHQRIGVILGSRKEVNIVKKYINEL
ncbi:fructose-1,6-bisphosphatase I [Candidatus Kinetoplastibacterium desouzaii TCC079E]|uniref:Fructose-1,6-bisphosphatase class 1 n=1 Tax=Candidatus Kinetoplastidibacterium desouzai TCC079E TaxID=1208919 RepID=M1LUD8_9PROT|nr:class 1 fructose-bisphosphatase [Candidatus Kinetoplastibacterium desouzaii]AGF46919.1 fructose-1,6-bisphosphatase I [Candidatus Kinetoplastibacterium desouzaii TCC079E]